MPSVGFVLLLARPHVPRELLAVKPPALLSAAVTNASIPVIWIGVVRTSKCLAFSDAICWFCVAFSEATCSS